MKKFRSFLVIILICLFAISTSTTMAAEKQTFSYDKLEKYKKDEQTIAYKFEVKNLTKKVLDAEIWLILAKEESGKLKTVYQKRLSEHMLHFNPGESRIIDINIPIEIDFDYYRFSSLIKTILGEDYDV